MVNLVEFRRVVELLERYSTRRIVDKALETAGVGRALLTDTKGFVPYAAEAILIETVARSIGERHLGAKLGRDFDYMTYGAYSVYVLSAPDLSTALDRGRRALLYIHPGSEIVLRRTQTHLLVGRDSSELSVVGHRHLDEGALFVISQVANHFLGADWRPDWVELPNVQKGDMKLLEELTETVVRTDCKIPSVAVRLTDLSALNPSPPISAKPLSLSDLGTLMGISPAQTAVEAVEQILNISSLNGNLNEKSVAQLLAISPRTMQRALKSEGTSFRDIRSAFINKQAKSLLSQSENSFDDIAKKLCYADARSFRRAFKKATGRSPSEFRRTHKPS